MRESNFHFPSQNKACVCITSALYDRRAIDSTSPLSLLSTLTHLSYLTSTSPRIREILCADGGIERLISILTNIGKRMRAQREVARKEMKLISSSASSVSSSSVGGDSEPPTGLVRSPFKPFGIVKRQIATEAAASGQSGAVPLAAHQAAALGLTKEQKHTLWTWSLAFQCVVNVGVRGSENVRTRVVEAGVVPIVIGILGGFLHDLDRKRTSAEKSERDKRRRSEKGGSSATSSTRSSHRHNLLDTNFEQTLLPAIVANLLRTPRPLPPTAPLPSRPSPPRVAVHPATPTPSHAPISTSNQVRPFRETQHASASRARVGRNPASTSLSRQSTVDQTPDGSEEGSVTGEEDDEVGDADAVMAMDSSTEDDKTTPTSRRQRRGTIKAGNRLRNDASSSTHLQSTVVRVHPLSALESFGDTSSNIDGDGDVTMEDPRDGPGQTPRPIPSRLSSTDTSWSEEIQEPECPADRDMALSQSGMTITLDNDGSLFSASTAMGREIRQAQAQASRSGSLVPGPISDAPGTPEDELRLPVSVDQGVEVSTSGISMGDSPLAALVQPHGTSQPIDESFGTTSPPSPASQLCFRDEDVLLALQLLAYLSKYPHVRAKFHEPAERTTLELAYGSTAEAARAVASFAGKVKAERGVRERMKEQHRLAKEGKLPLTSLQDKQRRAHGSCASTFSTATDTSKTSSTSTSSTTSVVSINPLSTNVFSFVERFTHRSSSHDKHALPIPEPIQYWAGVIMRNACRKDDNRGGIRQCANMQCGVWEQFPREFAKCRRCRKAKYCSKTCQSKAWQLGHRFWCSVKDADPVADGMSTGGDNEAHTHTHGASMPSNDGDRLTVPSRAPGSRRRQRDVAASDDDDGELPAGAPLGLGNRAFNNPISRPGGGGATIDARTESADGADGLDGLDALRTLGEMNAELLHAATAGVAAGDMGIGGGMLQDEADVARRMLMSLEEGAGEIVVARGAVRNGLR